MADLDDKLKDILEDLAMDAELDASKASGATGDYDIKSYVAQIKQAFEDAGYRNTRNLDTAVASLLGNKEVTPVMTGREWYERFEHEIYKFGLIDKRYLMSELDSDKVMAAAKKAAGLG